MLGKFHKLTVFSALDGYDLLHKVCRFDVATRNLVNDNCQLGIMNDENRKVKINSDNAPETISPYILNLINIFELSFASIEDESVEIVEQDQSYLIDEII